MTGKDVLKIMLCICGYDRDINVTTYRGDNNEIGYVIQGTDKFGDTFEEKNCEGLIYNIENLINDAYKRNISIFSESELLTRHNLSIKDIINDSKRKKICG